MAEMGLERRVNAAEMPAADEAELLKFFSKHPGEVYTAESVAELLKKKDAGAVDKALAMLSERTDNYIVILRSKDDKKASSYRYDKDCAEAQTREDRKISCCMLGECGTTSCLREYQNCHSKE
ncbi:MAG: hypothetical protein PHC66_02925 [Candidatus Nanoarchaeia archaeon]|nr:hypothetical protein [Candidatus Nanoarchaeia archaeon]MDD5239014.1 hypothetical protein [Candidatus Nanoarchaeia archaeon]